MQYWLNTWNGSAWGSSVEATASGIDQLMPGIDVAFEGTSGEAVAAYGVNGSNVLRFRTWTSGGGWSAEQNGPTLGAAPRVVTLTAERGTDRVMLMEQDANSDLYAAQWNGTAWGSATLLEANTGETNNQPFDFIWESTANMAPVAATDSYSVAENGILTVAAPGVLGNDTDGDGDALTASLVSGPLHGSLVFNANGSFIYTPVANFASTDSFSYQVSDGRGGVAIGSVTLNVTPNVTNEAPTHAVPGAQTVATTGTLAFSTTNGNRILVRDDAGSNAVQVTLSATNGTLTLAGLAGLSFGAGDGTADATMTFTGTLAAINTALEGLVFSPTAAGAGMRRADRHQRPGRRRQRRCQKHDDTDGDHGRSTSTSRRSTRCPPRRPLTSMAWCCFLAPPARS